ncbi:ATP-binding cassette sub-family D member 3 [Octopus bimaculoides]|nr:ATP-binding cassette sub-family D member 3 [Octopus bimaculoides]|eukprot:XP_014776217.1 PREDICTED: ATP-binding cassette sub-family D member 3-like [Octopus bimaculoides]
MAPIASKLTPRSSAVITASGFALAFLYRILSQRLHNKKNEEIEVVIPQKDEKKEKPAVDQIFLARLIKILKIMIPGWLSIESWYLVMVALSLIARTYADVWMIQNGTAIESAIIGRDLELFKIHLFRFIYAMPAVSATNNLLKYGLSKLKLHFRVRLTNHLYEKYLKGFTFYKMSNLDNRISNPDQLLTQDVEKFCNSVADLYSNLSKPVMDVIIYSLKLTNSIGIQGPATMLLYLAISGLLLTRVRRPVAKLTMKEQRLEGEYRYVNTRLITNSEEVAFYQGNKREHNIIIATFKKMVSHANSFIFFRMQMGFIDSIIAKYVATVCGYLVVSRPFLNLAHPRHLHSTKSELLEDYYKSGRMLVKMAEATGRIVLAGREMTRLSGFTARVTELMQVLDELNKGSYKRTMVIENGLNRPFPLKPGSGKIIFKDHMIMFDKVPLVTPNGDVLIKEMTFEVHSGMNVLVCGPNGCGKSSLFRTLGELWPLFGGTLIKPDKRKLFYVPQRPYMAVGSLREQMIYPDVYVDQRAKNISDAQLEDILEKVQLGYLLEREGGWESVKVCWLFLHHFFVTY